MQAPNIIYILADDQGYGDVSYLNPQSCFPTLNIDRLGREGLAFSDAHSSSAVCTPSRYSILTGRYAWRTHLKRGVLTGTSESLIEPGRPTVASLLQQAGYRTGCFGKWHLGWSWPCLPGHTANRETWHHLDHAWIDYDAPIPDGPLSHGFDTFYGIAGSLDMPPYVLIDDDRPEAAATAWGTAREFFRAGPRQPDLRAHTVLERIINRATDWIDQQSADTPFFAYVPLTAPHTPLAPAPEFLGASGVSPYADFCMEVDHRVGQILAALERNGLDDNTIVIFTSDNGASAKPSECSDLEAHYGHFCSAGFRGYKSDIWDGGHRLPFLWRWPAGIAAGTWCHEPVGIFDLLPTAAALAGVSVPAHAAEDAISLTPALAGQPLPQGARQALINHSIDGRFAIRDGDWKCCRCPGSGGWSLPDQDATAQGLPPVQLYHLGNDPAETDNLAEAEPERVQLMTNQLHAAVISGRTTPGPIHELSEDDLTGWDQLDWRVELPAKQIADD